MVIPGDVLIRPMTADEVTLAVDAAAKEGWDPGLTDATTFRAADPEGFMVALLGDRPVGFISAVRYGDQYGFLGLFIVEEGLRGQGIGMRLWNAAMSRLDGRVSGLDGVLAMQDAYAASGYVFAHRNIRYAGEVRQSRRGGARASTRLEPSTDLDELCAYDAPLFGGPRRSFLAAWLKQPGAIALGFRDEGRLRGYAVCRPTLTGFKIGPLFADDPDVASRLMADVSGALPTGSLLTMDVPEPNEAGRAMAEALTMEPGFETARMYRGGDPDLPLDRVFGITSFELG